MFKNMNYRITVRIPKLTHQLLVQQSRKLGLPVAEFIRGCVENYLRINPSNSEDEKQVNPTESNFQEEQKPLRPIHFENNLLLRKIGRHINSQILLETDVQLERHIKKRSS